MNRITPRMRELARRLIELEQTKKKTPVKRPKRAPSASGFSGDSAPDLAHHFAAVEKLRPHLVILMSNLGFQALLLRARALAAADAPWLSELTVYADGSMGSPEKRDSHQTSETVRAGSHLFLAQVLTLLTAFIGEALTLKLMAEVWPDLSLDDLETGTGDSIEKPT